PASSAIFTIAWVSGLTRPCTPYATGFCSRIKVITGRISISPIPCSSAARDCSSGIQCERTRREATRPKILGLNKPHLVRVPAARIARLNTTPPTRSKCKMAMDTDSQSLRLRMEQGRQMAVEAGQITLQYFGRSIDILEKSD